MTLKTYTCVIEPTAVPTTAPLYWAYLTRIVNFTVQLDNEQLIYVGDSEETWSETQEIIQTRMVSKFTGSSVGCE